MPGAKKVPKTSSKFWDDFFLKLNKSAPNKKNNAVQPHLKFKLKDLPLHTKTKKNWNWSDFEDEDLWKEKQLNRNLAILSKTATLTSSKRGPPTCE